MKKLYLSLLGILLVWLSSSVFSNCDFEGSTFEQERKESYFWACSKWIISDWNISNAKIDKELTRIEMAKMLNIFSMEIMWKEEDPSKNCNWYSDLKNSNDISIANRACHLWIMWIWIDKFRPNDSVSRAEFGTVLSRILYWDKYNVTEWEFYKLHLKALKNNWIITNDNPNIKEMKWYVLLMLKRYIDRVEKENKSIEDAITLKNDNWYIAILGNDVIFSNLKDTITVSNDFTHIPYWKWSNSLQWPCAPWYHVPSKDEAIELVNIWSEIRKDDLDKASITSWSVVQKDYDKLKDKWAWDVFLSDIYWHDVKAAAGTERTSFRTRSKYSEYSPYSIQVVTSQVNVSYMACWLWCQLQVLCFKTK